MIKWFLLCCVALPLLAVEVELEFDFSKDDPLTAAIQKGAEEAYQLNFDGLDALEKHDFKLAEQLFKGAMSKIPMYSDAQNNLAVLYYRTGRKSEALTLWNAISVSDPSYHLSWYNLGLQALNSGKASRAADYLDKCIGVNKRFGNAYLLLSKAYETMGLGMKSLEAAQKGFTLLPKEELAVELVVQGYLSQGDTTKAISFLSQHQETQGLRSLLGQLYVIKGDSKKAVRLLSSKELSDDVVAQTFLAREYEKSGDDIALERLLLKVKGQKGSFPSGFYSIAANLFHKKGDVENALWWIRVGLDVAEDEELQYNLGQILYLKRDFKGAIKAINSLPSSVKDAQSYSVLAHSYWEEQAYEGVVNAIHKALSYESRSNWYLLLARALKKQGDVDAACIQLKKALVVYPDNWELSLELHLFEGGGDEQQLIVALEKRIEKCHSCFIERAKLSSLYIRNGEFSKARKLLQAFWRNSSIVGMALFHLEVEAGQKEAAMKVLKELEQSVDISAQQLLVLSQYLSEVGEYSESLQLLSRHERTFKGGQGFYYAVGYNNMRLQNYELAKAAFESALQSEPRNSATQASLAFVYHKLGEDSLAYKMWSANSKEHGDNINTFINLGLHHFGNKEYKKALQMYRKVLQVDSKRLEVYVNIGNVKYEMAQYREAYEDYVKGSTSSLKSSALCGMYWCLDKQGDLGLKEEVFNRISLLHKDKEVKAVLLHSALENGQFSKVVNLLENSKNSTKENIVLSRAYIGLKKFIKAKEVLKRVSTSEQDSEYLLLMQEVLVALGEFGSVATIEGQSKDLRVLYNSIIALSKGVDEASFYDKLEGSLSRFTKPDKLSLLKVASDFAIQKKDWNALLKWSVKQNSISSNAAAQYNCAVAYYNLGNIKESYSFYRKAQTLDRTVKNIDIEKRYAESLVVKKPVVVPKEDVKRYDSLYNKALASHGSGDLRGAEKVYRELLKENSEYYRAWNNLGAIYAGLGQLDSAIVFYRNAINAPNSNADGYVNLLELYIAIEEFGKARTLNIQSLKAFTDNKELLKYKQLLKNRD